MATGLARPHLTGDLNRAAEPQQFFSQRGFTRVRVRNDRERATTEDFGFEGSHGRRYKSEKSAIIPLPQCNKPSLRQRQHFPIQRTAGVGQPGQG